MSIFKCKSCGGELQINQGETVVTCDYCDLTQTLPRLDDERRVNLYDRANHFRRNNEFDKATGIYEQILNEDTTDAEAYWSLVLCRYGIEYVEDPSTHKRIPTVNRAQYTSIFDDDNYKSALQYADSYQRQVYEAEAKTINEIQKGILAISQKEEPFDVFICYKETDNNGRRTPDSVLANDLYHQLTQEGFKVFFARITLEDKLGSAYEPYIFAALNSAKVMVVLGTRPEFFKAVWVRNEWSRYLALIRQGQKKMLIPAYKDMDPYDLPEEFSHLQAQDMSKLGFMQDLIRGIKKILHTDEPQTTVVKETVVATAGTGNTAPLLKRAFMFLEDGDWNNATDYCEKVLDIDPECAQAYLGKLMAELRVKMQDDLKNQEHPFDSNNHYQKAIRFASNQLRSELSSYIEHIKQRNETARLEGIYNSAQSHMNYYPPAALHCLEAARLFESISEYKDSATLAQKCYEKAETVRQDNLLRTAEEKMRSNTIMNYEAAIRIFQSISGYKNADEQVLVCKQKIEEIKQRQKELAQQDFKNRVRLGIGLVLVISIIILVIVIATTVSKKENLYNQAVEYIAQGNIVDGYEALIELGGYKDSPEKADAIYDQYITQKNTPRVNSIITLGLYEQDNDIENGKESIEWIVLAIENKHALVISKYALDAKRYHSSSISITWEDCSLRNWLNKDFLNNAFSGNEKKQIETIYNNDKLFTLNFWDATTFFYSNKSRRCEATDYAKAQGVFVNSSNYCKWWIHNPDLFTNSSPCVLQSGQITGSGNEKNYHDGIGIRPVMWINLELFDPTTIVSR